MRTYAIAGAFIGIGCRLAACASDDSDGFTRTRADAMSYREAHAQCWARAYSVLGGNAMDMARQREFDSCMARDGWRDQRVLFGGGQSGPQSAGPTR